MKSLKGSEHVKNLNETESTHQSLPWISLLVQGRPLTLTIELLQQLPHLGPGRGQDLGHPVHQGIVAPTHHIWDILDIAADHLSVAAISVTLIRP